jgi:hypothetical protein
MADDSIFLVRTTPGGDELVEMASSGYQTEDAFQGLLERYPNLLAGAQINPNVPRRWLLVGREFGVPREEGGADQWSIDHLFVDQDGIPTIVEVKRASDTRIRREVVGQMLDYAANGVRYWPVDRLRAQFDQSCERAGRNASELIQASLGVADAEALWQSVRTNLQAGRMRLLFVADRIPPELQRIVEFLNEQMQQTEVLALEIRRYAGSDLQTLVPKLIGFTAQARETKDQRPGRPYDELLKEATPAVQDLGHRLLSWAGGKGLRIRPTTSARYVESADGVDLLGFYPGFSRVEFNIAALRAVGLNDEADRTVAALTRISGRKVTDKYPQVACEPLLAQWTELRDRVLPEYIAARLKAAATTREP